MQTARNWDAKGLWQTDLDHCMHPWTDLSDWPRTGSTIMVRGEGAYVWNAEGEKFIDGIGGLWFANVGFGRQELIDAATRQLGMLPQYSYFTDIGNPPATELAANQRPVKRVRALTFVIRRNHEQYAGNISQDARIAMIRGARGTRGANVEYISNTVEQLNTHGIYCGTLRAVYAGARGEGQ